MSKPTEVLDKSQKLTRYLWKVNWDIIRDEYICNPITLEELAVKYKDKIGLQSFKRHSAMEGWPKLRDEHRTKTEQKRLEIHSDNAISNRQRLIQSIEELVNLKITAEKRVLVKTSQLTDADLRLLASILSKSKNNIPDLTKIAELLKGNATDRNELTAPQKQVRIGRLREMLEPSES